MISKIKRPTKKQGRRQTVYRICAVCGRRHGVTYGFRNTLAHFGIAGDKATVQCIDKLRAKEVTKG